MTRGQLVENIPSSVPRALPRSGQVSLLRPLGATALPRGTCGPARLRPRAPARVQGV